MRTTGVIFKENLVRLRKQKFPTQEAFAIEIGYSIRGYQKYEQGESQPTPEVLDKFAEKLGCEPWELITPQDIVALVHSLKAFGKVSLSRQPAPGEDEVDTRARAVLRKAKDYLAPSPKSKLKVR